MPSQAAATPGFFAHAQPAREVAEGHARDRLAELPGVLAPTSEPEFVVGDSPAVRPQSIGSDLERSRLEHRARRLHAVVRALDDRVHPHRERGEVPPALSAALADFSAELSSVRSRLGPLSRDNASAADLGHAARIRDILRANDWH